MADQMIELVRGTLVKLYDYYSCADSPNVQVLNGSERTHIEGESIGCSDPYEMVNSRFERFLKAKQSIGCSNEIDKYLAENCGSRKGDVLAVSISTVTSESAFSTGGRILDLFRSSLSPLRVQNLVCAQDWLQALIPISFRKSKDELETLEDEFHDFDNILTTKLFVY